MVRDIHTLYGVFSNHEPLRQNWYFVLSVDMKMLRQNDREIEINNENTLTLPRIDSFPNALVKQSSSHLRVDVVISNVMFVHSLLEKLRPKSLQLAEDRKQSSVNLETHH